MTPIAMYLFGVFIFLFLKQNVHSHVRRVCDVTCRILFGPIGPFPMLVFSVLGYRSLVLLSKR